ncbi:MAG: YlxM family DNA-binding protein [Clostridia bacterium]|nr:YlxM family DNA-binding protein [Clostridia bacterium]
MEKRVELTLLMDFYGPLLTEHRREILSLYCDEDMSFQEIADQLGISRQGVHDAVKSAEAQLARYEKTLGLASRYRQIAREVRRCRALLGSVRADGASQAALSEALEALDRISGIEAME